MKGLISISVAVGLDEGLVEAHHEADRVVDLRRLEAELEGQLARLVGLEAERGVDVLLVDLLGGVVGDLFDLHAAGLRGHEDDLAGGAVEHEAEVELAVDGRAGFDEQALDFLSLRAGLVRDELHAEDGLASAASASSMRLDDLDAAALAASAGVDLRLDDDGGVACAEERLGGRVGLFERGGHLARRDRDAVLAQDVFRLVLVNLHRRGLPPFARMTQGNNSTP